MALGQQGLTSVFQRIAQGHPWIELQEACEGLAFPLCEAVGGLEEQAGQRGSRGGGTRRVRRGCTAARTWLIPP